MKNKFFFLKVENKLFLRQENKTEQIVYKKTVLPLVTLFYIFSLSLKIHSETPLSLCDSENSKKK